MSEQRAARTWRLLLTIVVVPAIFYFVYWFPIPVVVLQEHDWIRAGIAVTCAVGAGCFLWAGSSATARSLPASVAYGAIVGGAIGFGAGFFGPILLAPDSNQGPLLGIFITGPAGVVLGAVGGLVYGLAKRRRPRPPT